MSVHLEKWGEGDLPLLERLLGDPAMTGHLGGRDVSGSLRQDGFGIAVDFSVREIVRDRIREREIGCLRACGFESRPGIAAC